MLRIKILILLLSVALISHAQTAELYYNEGVKLKDEKRSAEAIEKFKKAVQLQPDYTAAHYEIGWCSNDVKDYTTAMISLRKARPVWSTIPKVYFELGYAFEKLDMYDSAVNSFNECLRLKPDYSLAHKELGNIAYFKEKYPAALQYFAGYIQNAKSEIRDYLFWYRKGFMENAEKTYTVAKESLQKSLMYKQDYINTYLELGFTCNKLKEGDDAIAWYQKALALDAKSHIPYNGIGEVYRDTKKDIDAAMEWYKKALVVKTDERKACFGMGYCLNSKDKYSEAIPYLQKAIQQENTYTAAYVELGYSYYMVSRNEDALKQFEKALSLNAKNENARYYAGLVYINQKNKAKAQQMADELKAMSSKNAATLQGKIDKM
jgi:tetratricopeptide (TPR) repeat protein